jgi:hypothetical protein
MNQRRIEPKNSVFSVRFFPWRLFCILTQCLNRRNLENAVVHAIGTLNEKSLHAELKQWYSRPGDLIEGQVDRFAVDIVRGDLLIEIQTRNLFSIRSKLKKLLKSHPVRLIYPIAQDKWIVRQSRNGRRTLSRRKSPKHGVIESVFEELVSIAQLLAHPNFSLEAVFIQEEEIRRLGSARNWRRKGWGTYERRLLRVVNRRLFETPQDMLALIPANLSEAFTSTDLAEAIGQPVWLAQKMTYCLRIMGALAISGKRGRSILHVRAIDQS